MIRLVLFSLVFLLSGLSQASAQQSVFIQIEAQPNLAQAQSSIRRYATRLQDINGFALASGWYGIALGPYREGEAAAILRNLRTARLIPGDSYIARASEFGQQFWPIGANVIRQPSVLPRQTDEARVEPQDAQPQPPEPETQVQPVADPDETPRQARASEARLTRQERAALQEALQWAGFYSGAIDAAFGRGTRASMARWQEANNFEVTGILTTRQRAELFRQYNAVLEGIDLRVIQDASAGIEMKLPMGVVQFRKYEPPFAHYDSRSDLEARVLLISQAGNRNTLIGLYDIMQTLAIVPQTGPRTIERNAFTLIGENDQIVSHTQAWLKEGEIKGFTLIWPSGDEERRRRVLGEMQESFVRLEGALDPAAGQDSEQSIDLVAGLKIRKPKLSRSGFYVDTAGTVVTTSEILQSCGRLTIDERYDAEIRSVDEASGIVVLRPTQPLAPIDVAAFNQAVPRLQSDIAVAGYSYGGVLGAPTVTFGQLADVKGLNGERQLKRLALNALEGDAGGPVVDAGGAVVGMLLPDESAGRQLPDGVSFAAKAEVIRNLLEREGITPRSSQDGANLPPETLTKQATRITVLVSCWD